MVSRLAFFLVIVAAFAAMVNALEPPPIFVLDLDAAPQHRWDGAVELIASQHSWEYGFGAIFDFYGPRIAALPAGTTEKIKSVLESRYPSYLGELQSIANGFAKIGHSEVTADNLTVWTFFYELSHIGPAVASRGKSCSGILSLPVDKSMPMIHGRNMDEGPLEGRNITLHIKAVRGGQLLYESIEFAWFAGALFSILKLNTITLEENWREMDQGFLTYEEIMERIMDNKTVGVSMMYRTIVESNMSFSDAIHFLNTSQFASPFFGIMSGPGRVGAVITAFFNSSNNVVEYLTDESPTTFIVQTNYDRWLPDPPEDPRRTVAEGVMKAVGPTRRATELGVWMALGTFPVHNPSTMFSVLMSVEADDIEGYIRQPMVPTSQLSH